MQSINATYDGFSFVPKQSIPVKGKYEVIITFIEPIIEDVKDDNHAIIWYYENSHELPKQIEKIIDDPSVSVYICSVSLWEIAIKMNLGKLNLEMSLDELLDSTNFWRQSKVPC